MYVDVFVYKFIGIFIICKYFQIFTIYIYIFIYIKFLFIYKNHNRDSAPGISYLNKERTITFTSFFLFIYQTTGPAIWLRTFRH